MVYGMQCQGIISGEKVEHQGALVLLNAESGEILAMSSHPSFDANRLQEGWDDLVLREASRSLHDAQCVVRSLVQQRAVTAGGSTSSRYACGWASNNSQLGMDTTRAAMPSAARSSWAPKAVYTSEPLAMSSNAGASTSAST